MKKQFNEITNLEERKEFLEVHTSVMTDVLSEMVELHDWSEGNGDGVIGLRFEEKLYEVGDELPCSKHNLDRESEHDMPEWGAPEYEEMFELDGTSSLHPVRVQRYLSDGIPYYGSHCYIIKGDYTTNEGDALDDDELVIANAKVLYRFY